MFLAYQSVMTTHSLLSTTLVIVNRLIVHKSPMVRHGGFMITDDLASLWSISCRYIAYLGVKTAICLTLVEDLT